MTLRELANADLGVCVLNAMQPVKDRERSVIAYTQELLGGNLVAILNRMQDVSSARRSRIVDDVRRRLGDIGNDLIGRSRIYIADAEQPLTGVAGQRPGVPPTQDSERCAVRSHRV